MEDVCKTLLNTYNTNLLDGLDTDLQQALKREAECSEQNPNSSGKDREILVQLIKNHYDKDKIKPSAKFIGGPKTLTVHYLSEYQKKIYIFGEHHDNIMDCNTFDNFDKEKDVITSIEDYLYKLITNTDVFIDIFVEFFSYDKSGEYSIDPYDDDEGRIEKLFKIFRKCLQKNTRHDEDCKLARIHYIDIRTEIGQKKISTSIFAYANRIETIKSHYIIHKDILNKIDEIKSKNQNKNENGYLYYFLYTQKFEKEMTKDEILRIWNEDMKKKQKDSWAKRESDDKSFGDILREEINTPYMKKIIFDINTKDDNKYKTYWKQLLRDNEFLKKENKRHIENPALKDHILTFMNNEMDEIVMRDKKEIQKCLQNIRQNILQNKRIYNYELIEYNINLIELLIDPETIILDYYALLRIFTNFNMTNMEKAYTGATDQPSTANNIIIYAGDYHSDRYRRFLKSIGNDPIEKTGNFLDDTTLPQNCIGMTGITQPFFK
jgi:hypothetical protein